MYRKVAAFQSIYMLITGVWPLVSMDTFIAVTGPKVDLWLVEMVGCLAISLGAGLLAATICNRFDLPLLVTMLAGSLAFLGIDVVYSLRDVIRDVYLFDAVLESVFVCVHTARIIKLQKGR